ncbi:hypothetical protein [uncultured Neisseria sp.]|uniref:hypothetical protein n=1 Tax=uncultured Neisseria sp. TaxID=237778 RepID=UPI00262E4464|nr:hypothetical protein [uncultured Neisseria sp.]
MKLYTLGISIILLAGCVSIPKNSNHTGSLWVTVSSKDEFTDQTTKMVTVGERRSNHLLITQSLHFYPFVGVQNGEIYVGVRSGGPVRIPVGTIQLRIDDNPAWTITPAETPVFLAPNTPAVVNSMQEQIMNNMSKAMSPYTATTGDKARRIIKEIVHGRRIKYRNVGFNQAASTTGEVEIDGSFIKSLKEIGINPESF